MLLSVNDHPNVTERDIPLIHMIPSNVTHGYIDTNRTDTRPIRDARSVTIITIDDQHYASAQAQPASSRRCHATGCTAYAQAPHWQGPAAHPHG